MAPLQCEITVWEQVNELLWQSPCVQGGDTIFLVVLIALVCTV